MANSKTNFTNVNSSENVIRTLHQLAHAAYCGQAPWPCSRETCEAIYEMLGRAGLYTPVPEWPDTFSLSARPGSDLDVLLHTVGALDAWDLPTNTSEEDLAEMEFAPTEAEALEVIRRIKFTVYEQHFLQSSSGQ